MDTTIINIIGQPGAGKSVTRADVFARLKRSGVATEEVTEFAKDLVWEERAVTMRCQPYIFGKQLRNLERLLGKVEVIITDSPLLLCSYYNRKYRAGAYPEAFDRMVVEQYKAMNSLTFFIDRVRPYETIGRTQSADESDVIGAELERLLNEESIPYMRLPGDESAAAAIQAQVLALLRPANIDQEAVTAE